MMQNLFIAIMIFLTFHLAQAAEKSPSAITAPIPIDQLKDFKDYPLTVQQLITQAKKLTELGLTYQYGSADPSNAGMDCSGTIYYLITHFPTKKIPIPRQSDQQYEWALKKGHFNAVTAQVFSSQEFSQLKPGDLLFWSGTYRTLRESSVSHVMIYLGKNKAGEPLMFGASNGRPYQGKKMWGVSVFDFKLPAFTSFSRFVGYGCIPELTCKS